MAKADLNLHVGTTYDGQGLQKLDSGIRSVSKLASSAGRTVASVTSAMASLGQQAGKAAGAIGKFAGVFGALAQGGLVGAAIAGATMLIGKFKQMADEAEEAAKRAAEAFREVLGGAVGRVADEMEKINAKAGKFFSEANSLRGHEQRQSGRKERQAVAEAKLSGADEVRQLDAGWAVRKKELGVRVNDAKTDKQQAVKAYNEQTEKIGQAEELIGLTKNKIKDAERRGAGADEMQSLNEALAQQEADLKKALAARTASEKTMIEKSRQLDEAIEEAKTAELEYAASRKDLVNKQQQQQERLKTQGEEELKRREAAQMDAWKKMQAEEEATNKKKAAEEKVNERTKLIKRQQLLDEKYADQMEGLNAEIEHLKDRLKNIAGSGWLSDSAGGGGGDGIDGSGQHNSKLKMERRLANLQGRKKLSDKEEDERRTLERMLNVGEWAAVNKKLQGAQAERDKLAQEQAIATKDIKIALDQIKENMGI